jgi:hypothetical protein
MKSKISRDLHSGIPPFKERRVATRQEMAIYFFGFLTTVSLMPILYFAMW